MKRSDFEEIVNQAAAEEMKCLSGKIKDLSSADTKDEKAFFADLYIEGILASARTTARIIENLGLVVLTDD